MPSKTRLSRSFPFQARPVTLVTLILGLILTFSPQLVASSFHSDENSRFVRPALTNPADGPAHGIHGFHTNDTIVADLHRHKHDKRRERDDDDEGSQATATPAPTPTRTVNESPSPVSIGTEVIIVTPSVTDVPIPSPFDTNLNTKNFTAEGCPAFFEGFLNDDAFKDCVPMSLFIRTSSEFGSISRSFARITRLLETACAAPKENCSRIMTDLADRIVEDDACGADYDLGNPLVVMARDGFLGYPYVRDATCLMNPDTDNYCFADSSSNTTNTSGVYPFYIGVGLVFPSGTRPLCNRCLEAVMQIYAEAAQDKEQPASQVYNDAAGKINIGCGPSFVDQVSVTSSGASALSPHIRREWVPLGLPLRYALPYAIWMLLLSNMI